MLDNDIVDIFSGQFYSVWTDGETYFVSFPGVTLHFDTIEYNMFRNDMINHLEELGPPDVS